MSRYRYAGRHRHGRPGLVHIAEMFAGANRLRTAHHRPRWWRRGASDTLPAGVIPLRRRPVGLASARKAA